MANWLHGVAQQTAMRLRATAAKRGWREVQMNEMPEPAVAETRDEELLSLLDEELRRLPERFRALIVLCDLENHTRKDVARQLGCPEGTVASGLARARDLLAKRLSRRGLAVSGGSLAATLSHSVAADVPPTVVTSTINVATLLAAGKAAGVISGPIAALSQGVLKAMVLKKITTTALAVLALGVAGAGVLRLSAPAAEPRPPKTDKPVPKGGAEPEPAKPIVVRERALLQRMAMSADGEFVATVGVTRDGETNTSTVKLWDTRTGKLKRALDEVKDSHLELALSRDFLAIGVNGKLQDTDPRGPREVWLLDAKTLELKHKIDENLVPGVANWSALAFSPDGKRLAVAGFAEGAFVKLWDVEKQKLIEGKADLGEISRELNRVGCLAFSPDGKVVAAAWDDGKIRLFDGRTGDFATVLDPELKPESSHHGIAGIAFSPDSKTLASKGGDNTPVLWDLMEGKPRQTLKEHKGALSAVAFSGDGRWIATGARTAKEDDYEVILWDTKTGNVKHAFPSLTEPVHVLAFTPDGKMLAVCGGGGRGEGQDIKMSGELTLFRLE